MAVLQGAASLTATAAKFRLLLIPGEPTRATLAQRLRVLRGSAADPLNLIQVMLAKGLAFPFTSRVRNGEEQHEYDEPSTGADKLLVSQFAADDVSGKLP
jgi:hypothetical protein